MQWLVFIGGGLLVVFVINKIWQGGGKEFFPKRKRKDACPKCDGLGYWEGLRGKETCNLCKGSGTLT